MNTATTVNKQQQKIILEVVWWLITGLVLLGILYPIWVATDQYPFYSINIIFIIAFITISRHIFLLKYTFLSDKQIIKGVLVFVSIPLIFNLVNNLNYFITSIDENSYTPFLGHLNSDYRVNMEIYIRSEMLLFGVGSIISSLILPFRMILSIWRQRNRGTI